MEMMFIKCLQAGETEAAQQFMKSPRTEEIIIASSSREHTQFGELNNGTERITYTMSEQRTC